MTTEGWGTSRIEEVVRIIYRYPTFYGLDRPSTGVPVVRGEHLIENGEISTDLSQYWFVSNEDSKRFPNTVLEEHDIVMAVRGTVGKFSRARQDHCGFQISPNTIRISPDPARIHPPYLFFALHSKEVTSFLLGSVATSAVPGIRAKDIKVAPLLLPSINEQKAISLLLTSLYDKIELNRKTNETLEAMAKALFKSWFVDFDPVRAKAEGRPTGLPDEISDLFPDSFEDSELGEIPSGWRVGSLDQIGINPRKTVKPEDMDSSDRYIGLEHMPRGSICLGESGQAEELESNKNRFKQGDILFGKLRPYFKKTGYCQFDGVCSTDIVVVRQKEDYGVGFICCFLASDPFIDFTVAASSGTRMPRTSWKDMCEFPFATPSKSLLREFDNQFCCIVSKITSNCLNSASLAALRDILLPKLISGEMRIPDAEKLLEEVGI